MQRYWLKILIGALATFGLGMLFFTAVRGGARKIERLKDSSEPINIPLAFIPFTVDGQKLGTLRGLRVLRSTPEKVERLEFRVKVDAGADSVLPEGCMLTVRDPEHIDGKNAFECLMAKDTAGKGLALVGHVEFPEGRVISLIAPQGALDSFNFDFHHDADSMDMEGMDPVVAESIGAAAESTAMEAAKQANEIVKQANEAAKKAQKTTVKPATPPATPKSAPQAKPQ